MKNVLSAIETAVSAARISPADLLELAAEALAATGCTCRDLPADSVTHCRSCREAAYLAKIADQVDMQAALAAVTEACGNVGVDLADLLPAITECILARDPESCTCDATGPCTICTAARSLDELSREMLAA